jgi:hypothetical protein
MRRLPRCNPIADPADQRRYAGDADRDVGTEPGCQPMPVDASGALRIGRPHRPQERRSVGRSATEPSGDGQVLLELDGAENQRGVELSQQRKRLLQQVRPLYSWGEWTRGRDPAIGAWMQRYEVADVGESH